MYKDGYFTFDHPELVKKRQKKMVFLMGDIDFTPNSPSYVDDILVVLKKVIRQLLMATSRTPKGADDVIQIANRTYWRAYKKSTILILKKNSKFLL
jgi:hypothetical protein